MALKLKTLVVESQPDWLNTLKKAFEAALQDTPLQDSMTISRSDVQFDIQAVQHYDEAMSALESGPIHLVVVDPVLDVEAPNTSNHTTSTAMIANDKHHGVELLTRLMLNYPNTELIVVSGSVGRELLRTAPDLLGTLSVIPKQNWNESGFIAAIQQAVHRLQSKILLNEKQSGERWGPPEPDIKHPELPIDASSVPVSTHHSSELGAGQRTYAGLTGPLSNVGLTGPLTTGLVPPAVGSRPGAPRILIVESSPEWQHQLAALCENEGYFWRVASDYEQAKERLGLESFHVVLLDMMIGEAGLSVTEGKGWPLLEYLINDSPKTKVIISSGHIRRNDLVKLFMRYPLKGFIDKKDFNPTELLEAIREQHEGPSLRIQTLGDFRIWRDDKAVTSFDDPNAEKIIKILLTRRGEKVSVEELNECIWPNSDPETNMLSLGTMVSNARLALEPDLPRPNDSHFILRDGANYLFNIMGKVDVDAEEFRRLVSEGRQHERHSEANEALEDYETARTLYQGDYLPDERTERWANQERTTLQGLYTTMLNRIADIYASTGRMNLAIEAANRSMQIDSYNESTYRRLMRYYTCEGNRKAAIGVYRKLVKLFSEFFGEEPTLPTTHLYRDIEAGLDVNCVEAAYGSGEWRLNDDQHG